MIIAISCRLLTRVANRAGRRRLHRLAWPLLVLAFFVAHSPGATAQAGGDPLNDSEVDQVREVADQPVERVKLYMKFIAQRTDAIQEMVGDTKIQNKPLKIHNLLEEFTRLVDELQDNLDSYDQVHGDMRKALKELVPDSEKWLAILAKPPADQSYDFARKTALEAGQSLAEQAKKLQTDQAKWFAEHKPGKNPGGESVPPK